MQDEGTGLLADLLPDAILLVNSQGTVSYANPAAADFLGRSVARLIGSNLVDLSDDAAGTLALLRACSRSRSLQPGSLQLDTSHGAGTVCRCDGAVYRPRSADAPAVVLLRLTTHATAADQFIALNLRIEELSHEIGRRRAAESALQTQSNRLNVTLQSIGDAVIATDRLGHITMMNPVAQALTGWPLAAALDRPLDEVFRIVNEDTRETVESPVRKVLREGGVVGLANHTVLIARDGTERPIDDSGAPIKDENGQLIGVVLVFHDITERHQLERELQAQARRLQDADRRKDDFLSMLAHELRNPLAPLTTGVHLLCSSSLSPDALLKITAMMGRQLRHLSRLVDDLLDVARLTRGSIELRKGPVLLADAIDQAIEVSLPLIESKRLQLSREPVPAALLDADMTRLVQVFGNILSNAAKFTPPEGAIFVTTRLEADVAVVRIADSGEGMDPALLPNAFDLFTQGHRSLDRSQGGLGVGLTVVRAIVELHGGQVGAHSEGPGRGSTLEVRLPLSTGSTARVDSLPGQPDSDHPQRLRVLVVDDNADAAEMLSDAVASWGHQARRIVDPSLALDELDRNDADVVILDIGMPGIDGYELAGLIKRRPTAAPALLIAVTGYGSEADRRRGFEAGFDEFLAKPVDLDELARLIRRPTIGRPAAA